MRKLLVAVLAVICLTSLAVAVGCVNNTEPNYYTLNWSTPSGISIQTDIPENNEVKEGYAVQFSLVYEEDEDRYIMNNPQVTVSGLEDTQGTTLTANEDGIYTFTITQNSIVRVSGIVLASDYTVTFGSTDTYRISYSSDDGDTTTGITVQYGTPVSFTLNVSSYYKQEGYYVLANTQIIEPVNGEYTVTVYENTNITVQNLEQDDDFITRGDGNGTPSSPFLLKKPIDLYAMAALINDSYYTSYYDRYYKLENDIDMGGEQLFIIGDSLSGSTAFFGGDFNGNGHKISNYYIADTVVDQETFSDLFIPYIGMFGLVSATVYSPVNIYNLTLSDFEIVVDAANEAGSSAFIGGIVGQAFGANITGCKVENATYTINADNQFPSYVGGIAGLLQSAYQSETIRYMSSLTSCAGENVDIEVLDGYVYAAGGLCGYLITADELTPAYVINSYFTGSVSGLNTSSTGIFNVGGIVGLLSEYGVIQNCYTADSYLAASSNLQYQAGALFHVANAGGIVGYAYGDTLIANSFTTGNRLSATASTAAYQSTGAIAGYSAKDSELMFVSSLPAMQINCLGDATITNEIIKNTLKWGEEDWVFGISYPTINYEETSKTFNLTLVGRESDKFNGQSSITTVLNIYLPMSYLYIIDSYAITEYVESDGGLRSYGYYFDAELTQRVPNSFIPIDSITLYIGLSDYSEVAGTYYVDADTFLVLHENGVYTYCSGAMIYNTYYLYDGETITFYACPLFVSDSSYVSAKATLSNGILSLYDNINNTVANAVAAKSVIENFEYGEYYDEAGNVYQFNADLTVTVTNTANIANVYTFEMTNGTTLTLSNDVTCTVVNGIVTTYGSAAITKFDDFKGVWDAEAAVLRELTLDGKGNWSILYYYYENGERVQDQIEGGTYAVVDGVAQLSDDTSVIANIAFDENGYLTLSYESRNYEISFYRSSSFVGTWTFSSRANDPITLETFGIPYDGIGSAVANYIVSGYALQLTYDYDEATNTLSFFYMGSLFGQLEYDTEKFTLNGSFYSLASDQILENRVFFLNDSFSGTWVSTVEGIDTISFNGYGLYNERATDTHMAVRSSFAINGQTIGRYTLPYGMMAGYFTYNNVTYYLFMDNGVIEVTIEGGEEVGYFVRPDAMYQVTLYSSNATYEFDGNGILTVTTAGENSTVVKYDYEVSGTSITLTQEAAGVGVIEITQTDGVTTYTLTMNDEQPVTLSTTQPN